MTLVTLEPELDTKIAATQAAEDAAWVAAFEDRSIFDFRVAYLISEAAADTIVSAENMNEVIGAVPVYSWDAFITLHEQQPFHLVLIHRSMVGAVDKTWTADAYRNGIFIAGINLRQQQLADIVGDKCRKTKKKELLDYVDNTYLLFVYHVRLEDESQRDYVNRMELEECQKNYVLSSPAVIDSGTIPLGLYSRIHLEYIGTSFVVETVNLGIPKP
jgi:hypothetical protein